MSFEGLLAHRCDLYGLITSDRDGSPITSYQKINTKPIKCRLDLNFVRQGKDPMWMATASRPEDRMGVFFFLPNAPLKVGLRAVMLKGPGGIFQLRGAIDEAWGYDSLHHYEVGASEVSTLQWRAPESQQLGG